MGKCHNAFIYPWWAFGLFLVLAITNSADVKILACVFGHKCGCLFRPRNRIVGSQGVHVFRLG